METPNQIDALADQAATHWPMVRFHPTLGGGWCASALGAPEMRAATLSEVVAMAAACKPMPIVPRCPAQRVLRVEKQLGTNPWHIKDGSQVVYAAKTKLVRSVFWRGYHGLAGEAAALVAALEAAP